MLNNTEIKNWKIGQLLRNKETKEIGIFMGPENWEEKNAIPGIIREVFMGLMYNFHTWTPDEWEEISINGEIFYGPLVRKVEINKHGRMIGPLSVDLFDNWEEITKLPKEK